ncbi:hypothetical protein AVEN_39898-1 [Araneus ventricosus]|uniref:Reverse transcriptase domain-containing protein n=1 Tax=Araneus ventricosus TaxID=182803 RepID=A0A4Y2JRJ2_ARAVE|nr:hypothetical protein AVEN_39898-1 [Araneus ventricosus]
MPVTPMLPQPTEDWSYSSLLEEIGKANWTLNPTSQSPTFQLWAKYLRNYFWNDSTTTSEKITFNILPSTTYSFRTNRSTENAILDLLDTINSAKSSNQQTLMIFLDIKGAFDHLQYTSIKTALTS